MLIIEDEELAVEKLSKTIHAVDDQTEIIGVTGSIESSVSWLQKNPAPDIILMDIELSDGQSFEIFNRVEVKCPVIFTTSYDEYAIRAFKVNSIDYLLKPVEKEDLRIALEKYHKLGTNYANRVVPEIEMQKLLGELKNQLKSIGYRNRFLVRQGQQLISIEVGEIAYFFAEGRLSYFITWDKRKYVVEYSLEELEEMLDPRQFFRAGRAFIIHIRSVQQIHTYFNGKLKLTLKPIAPKADVIVSRERAMDFKKWMGK
jgi:two-component system, LytTR family, response regulator LytT